MTVNQMFSKLVDGIYAPVCILCGANGQKVSAKGSGALDICLPCEQDLITNRGQCYQCAIPLPAAVAAPLTRCAECLHKAPAFTHSFAPYLYQWPLDRLLQAFKFKADLAAGRVLATLLAKNINLSADTLPQALIPIPLHANRLRERGFNQAAVLANDIGQQLNIPLQLQALIRHKTHTPQAELTASARKMNVRGVFAAGPKIADLPAHVVLIDDVMTTGSTLSEAATTLLASGVQRVDCWVIARAPKPGK